jgi:Holliday junction DNA helicase RuvA
MIGYLKGVLTFKDPTFVILDVNGVGYEVKISLHTYSKIKDLESVLLHTHLHVKEDAHTLYGFFDNREKRVFLQLISISGVGPNTAMMINSSLAVDELVNAIATEQVEVIRRVKGIGTKTAHRIILELKDKIGKTATEAGTHTPGIGGIRDEALAALVTLGIAKGVAEKSINLLIKEHGSDISLEELIKLVLRRA